MANPLDDRRVNSADITTVGHDLRRPGDGLAPRMASIAFGGPDLRTVYIGSLLGTGLPTFRSPVPGRALSHWDKDWRR